MNGKQLIVSCMIILVIAITIVILKDFYDIDKCLDSSGKWNPKTKVCEK